MWHKISRWRHYTHFIIIQHIFHILFKEQLLVFYIYTFLDNLRNILLIFDFIKTKKQILFTRRLFLQLRPVIVPLKKKTGSRKNLAHLHVLLKFCMKQHSINLFPFQIIQSKQALRKSLIGGKNLMFYKSIFLLRFREGVKHVI